MADTHAPRRAVAARSGADMHAIVRTLGRTIAIPSASVSRAVEAPAELAQVPRRSGAIAGVMTLGKRLLPVVSLARWLDPAAGADPARTASADPVDAAASAGAGRARGLVLLLENGDACIGLAVDAVVGGQRIRPEQVRRLFHDDDPAELFQSAALLGDGGTAASILEPSRLMALAGVWVAAADLDESGTAAASDGAGGDARTGRGAPNTKTLPYATFRIADAHVALPAAHIGELLRSPPLRRELPAHDGILGLCEWRDRLVPVVDLGGALHALAAGDEPAWVCIVCEGELAIGVVMHELLGISKLDPAAGTPEHAPAAERSVVARRLVAGDRTLQVIDVTALLRRYGETALSSKGARAAQLRTTTDPGAPAYMVFEAGGLFAARIDGVQEVVALPDALRPRLDAGLSATLEWRRQPVPVKAIADSLVALPSPAARQLVIIGRDERFAALPIAGVKALVPRGVARRNSMRVQGRPVEVISVETEDHRASYMVVDLCAALPQPA